MTLRQDAAVAGADPVSLVNTGRSLVAIHDWTFLIGQTLLPGINALLLESLMYRSGLVPRAIALLGLDRRPAHHLVRIGTGCRRQQRVLRLVAIALVPIFLWELTPACGWC